MSKKVDPASLDVERQIIIGVVDLIRHKIFYGHILQQLTKVYTDGKSGMDTMGVGKRPDEMFIKLYVCRDFVRKIWSDVDGEDEKAWQHLLGVLEHEVLHIVFDHLSLTFSDKLRGNIAMDLVVNSCIDKNQLPDEACFPETYGFEPNKSAHWYYSNLKNNNKYQQQVKEGKFGQNGELGSLGGSLGSHEFWSEAANDPLLSEMCKDIVRKSKDMCNKDYGNVPGEVISQISEMLDKHRSVVPWNKVLRLFAASSMESNLDYTMKRLSKRFGTRPGTRKEDVLDIAVAVDTSASISIDQLSLFFNEIYWIWKNGAIVTVYEADADVQAVYKFRGKFNGDVHGRGGTDLEPVLKKTEGKYDALIYFTDFYAPRIEKRYNISTLWVLTTELERDQFPYPWGQHVKIEDGRAERA